VSARRPTPGEACAAIAAEHAAGVRAELEARAQIRSLADELADFGESLRELPGEIDQPGKDPDGRK
jgi:hypothetical protein